ncbi:class I SAM-dependent DNA methyltransferase [Actinomycetota bacterium]
MQERYTSSAETYDLIYADVIDYPATARQLTEMIRARKPDARSLLEVACGTGAVLQPLQAEFEVHGLDLSDDMLRVARAKLPGVDLRPGDMVDFDWGSEFDAVICMFSSIGYMTDYDSLEAAYGRFGAHLVPGGVVIAEGWLKPAAFIQDLVHGDAVGDDKLQVHRVSTSWLEDGGRVSVVDLHHLVGRPEGVSYFAERHRMGMFTADEHIEALESAGFDVEHHPDLFMGRGTYSGVLR